MPRLMQWGVPPALTPLRLVVRAQRADEDALRVAIIRTASEELHDGGSADIRARVGARLGPAEARVTSLFQDDATLAHDAARWVVSAHLRRQTSLCHILAGGDVNRWRDAVLTTRRPPGAPFGCEVARLLDDDGLPDAARRVAIDSFRTWESEVTAALATLQHSRPGTGRAAADVASLASAVVAILQGGYYLACSLDTPSSVEAAASAAAHLILNH